MRKRRLNSTRKAAYRHSATIESMPPMLFKKDANPPSTILAVDGADGGGGTKRVFPWAPCAPPHGSVTSAGGASSASIVPRTNEPRNGSTSANSSNARTSKPIRLQTPLRRSPVGLKPMVAETCPAIVAGQQQLITAPGQSRKQQHRSSRHCDVGNGRGPSFSCASILHYFLIGRRVPAGGRSYRVL